MTCCIFGVLLTGAVLSVTSFVRYRLLGHKRPPDPIAWHLEVPGDGTP
ncbi:MAG TPA: hypothetical protein VHZ95_22760 [Polyangiales bacterium]|nr:hypothetical protein [Polyangiales bacterium]